MIEKIYFGHPIDIYNTPLEEFLIQSIEELFTGFVVENPGDLHHEEGYQKWKRETGNGMDYFFKQVLPRMSAGVFLPFEDGLWGAGVYKEAEFLHDQGKPIWEISRNGYIQPMVLHLASVLSVEETRKRVHPEKS